MEGEGRREDVELIPDRPCVFIFPALLCEVPEVHPQFCMVQVFFITLSLRIRLYTVDTIDIDMHH